MLVSDPLANASRFVALVARKLTRDGKNQSGAGIDLHALLQVTKLHMCVSDLECCIYQYFSLMLLIAPASYTGMIKFWHMS